MIKTIALAALTTALLAMICATAAAKDTGLESLIRYATIVEKSDDHRGIVDGDSLVVSERATQTVVCVLRANGTDVLLSATGVCDGGAQNWDGGDGGYLDHAAIGVLSVDGNAGTWLLTHHFNAMQVSNDAFRGLLNRFTSAVDEITKRFGSSMTSERRSLNTPCQ